MRPMPTWDGFMLPVLRYLEDGATRRIAEIRQGVAKAVALRDEQRAETLPSGQKKADNRIGWAVSHLNRVGALERPSKGNYRITQLGHELMAKYPQGISETIMRTYAKPGDEWWKSSPKTSTGQSSGIETEVSKLDPTEQIEQGLQRILSTVAADLLTRLQEGEPGFFERVVVKLLVAMGYGGAEGTATVTPISNDEGIDGVIDRDALGLDRVYIQAKRYKADTTVQRPDLQSFVGALSGKATTGVFITTGRFSTGAVEYAKSAHTRIILIDGKRLTELMIRYGVGVQNRRTLHIVAVDDDFFE